MQPWYQIVRGCNKLLIMNEVKAGSQASPLPGRNLSLPSLSASNLSITTSTSGQSSWSWSCQDHSLVVGNIDRSLTTCEVGCPGRYLLPGTDDQPERLKVGTNQGSAHPLLLISCSASWVALEGVASCSCSCSFLASEVSALGIYMCARKLSCSVFLLLLLIIRVLVVGAKVVILAN